MAEDKKEKEEKKEAKKEDAKKAEPSQAAAKTPEKVSAKKVKDKWRAKSWYKVAAPEMFGGVALGETVSDEPDKVVGRLISATMQELTGDISRVHIKLDFRIVSVNGENTATTFQGHAMTGDYIRRLTRRNHSKIDCVYEVSTKDGASLVIKPLGITDKRVQRAKECVLRRKMGDLLAERSSAITLQELVKEMLSGELSKHLFRGCKPIYPLKRIEIRKSAILSQPTHVIEVAPEPASDASAGQPPESADGVQAQAPPPPPQGAPAQPAVPPPQ